MSRPPVSVVVPFAGSPAEGRGVVAMLLGLDSRPGDQLVLADNSGTAPPRPAVAGTLRTPAAQLSVVRAHGEASPAHARNVGAAAAGNDWILFLDADVRPPADLIERFFAQPIAERTGAVTGDITPAAGSRTLAARYGAARNFLGQRAHVSHPLRARASSANLLVRRAAFNEIGGYTEGIRAGEDTDLAWRLQAAGWGVEFNQHAVVQHAYRTSLRELGRQWRGYAAGARWLSERYPDFRPDPAINRALRLLLHRFGIGSGVAVRADGRSHPAAGRLSRRERAEFLCVQVYLAVEEQIGLRMSNQVGPGRRHRWGR
ncbi:MAG: glycosyltransferase [Actinomycetota bacterium]|nr:glycosyltransferase [Actinomycetota bacterium]